MEDVKSAAHALNVRAPYPSHLSLTLHTHTSGGVVLLSVLSVWRHD